jgi:hypothetical protein
MGTCDARGMRDGLGELADDQRAAFRGLYQRRDVWLWVLEDMGMELEMDFKSDGEYVLVNAV